MTTTNAQICNADVKIYDKKHVDVYSFVAEVFHLHLSSLIWSLFGAFQFSMWEVSKRKGARNNTEKNKCFSTLLLHAMTLQGIK